MQSLLAMCDCSCVAGLWHLRPRRGRQPRANAPSNLNVVRAVQRRAVERCLNTGDKGLVDRVLAFLEMKPPLLAWTNALAGTSFEAWGPPRAGSPGDVFTLLAADRCGHMALAGVREGSAEVSVMFMDTIPMRCVTFTDIQNIADGEPVVPVQSLWLDLSMSRVAAGRHDGSVHVWDIWMESLVLTCKPHYWETPHGCMTWGHDVPVSAISGPPRVADTLASADVSGMLCLWGQDGWRAEACIGVFGVGKTGASISSLATLPGLLLCGHEKGVVGVAVEEGQKPGVAFSVSMEGAKGHSLIAHTCLSMKIIAVTDAGRVLCWDMHQASQGHGVLNSAPKELCSECVQMRGRSIATVGAHGLCWLAPASSGKDYVVRWLVSESSTRYPLVFEAMLNQEPTLPVDAIAVLP